MESELKELLHNPKFLYSAAAVISIFLIVTCVDLYRAMKYNDSLDDFSNIEIDLNDGLSAEEEKLNNNFTVEREDIFSSGPLQSCSK